MLTFLKKFTVLSCQFLVVSFLLLVTLITPAFAQGSTSQLPAYIPPTSPLYTDLFVNNMFHTFSCLIAGSSVIGQPCLTYQITKNAQGVVSSVPVLSQTNLSGGALSASASLIGILYANPPIRTTDYLGSLGEQFGVVKKAHAQVVGSGANVLQPIFILWQVSRNIAYLIMIIVFVVIGLMVMFRNRINPQTVITAQAAIPGLIIGLILITFSYFLAGLVSDTAFVGTNLVGYYFGAARGDTSQNLLQDLDKYHGNVLGIFSRFTGIVTKENLSDALSSVWNDFSSETQGFLTGLAALVTAQMFAQPTEALKAIPVVGAGIQAGIVGLATLYTTKDQTAAAGLMFFVVATAILLYSMLKLLLRLISAFLTIIFLTISAPFQFLAASLPGRQGITTNWILNMLSNVLAFPAVLAVFYFVAFILGPNYPNVNLKNTPFIVSSSTAITAGSLTPPVLAAAPPGSITVVGENVFPLLGGLDLNFIRLLLAFGALIATPAIPDIISRTIGRAGQAGQLIGQEIGGSIGAGRGYAGQAQSGAGAMGQYGASARGLFGTPAYMPTGFENGKPTGWQYNPYGYQPNLVQKFQAAAEARKGSVTFGPGKPKPGSAT